MGSTFIWCLHNRYYGIVTRCICPSPRTVPFVPNLAFARGNWRSRKVILANLILNYRTDPLLGLPQATLGYYPIAKRLQRAQRQAFLEDRE